MRCYYEANRSTPVPGVPSPTPGGAVQNIALERLTLSQGRRRRMNNRMNNHSIQALAARIQTGVQIRSLIVVPGEGGQYHVVAGESRLGALQLLLRQGRIGSGFLVACRVIKSEPAPDSALVLAEEASLSYSVDYEKRCRFRDLRNQCPGLITGSELAIRELST